MQNHKARFCVRGDNQIEGVDYFKSCAPVVSWSTFRMIMNMAIQRGWSTRQVDFSNAFVQATLEEEVYVKLPDVETTVLVGAFYANKATTLSITGFWVI